MTATPPCDSQWNDFLIRRLDLYASAKYEILLQWLGAVDGRSVLVVGCGSGELAALLARRGARVTAVDIDEPTIELARATAHSFGVELTTFVARMETLATTTQYEIVVATDVVEHIEDEQAAARKLADLTVPGGRIVITVPAGRYLFGYHDEVLGHYRRYTARSLRRLFEPYLSIVKLRYFGLLLIPVAFAMSRLLRRPYPTATVGATAGRNRLVGAIMRAYFASEKWISPPAGTSVLLLGFKRSG